MRLGCLMMLGALLVAVATGRMNRLQSENDATMRPTNAVIIVDGNQALPNEDFAKAKRVLQTIFENGKLDGWRTSLALVAGSPQFLWTDKKPDSLSPKQFLSLIEGMRQTPQRSNLGESLAQALRILKDSVATNSEKLVIVMTDGVSEDKFDVHVSELRKFGVRFIVVPMSDLANRTALELLSGSVVDLMVKEKLVELFMREIFVEDPFLSKFFLDVEFDQETAPASDGLSLQIKIMNQAAISIPKHSTIRFSPQSLDTSTNNDYYYPLLHEFQSVIGPNSEHVFKIKLMTQPLHSLANVPKSILWTFVAKINNVEHVRSGKIQLKSGIYTNDLIRDCKAIKRHSPNVTILIMGHIGAGKSTTTNLAMTATSFDDSRLIVGIEGSGTGHTTLDTTLYKASSLGIRIPLNLIDTPGISEESSNWEGDFAECLATGKIPSRWRRSSSANLPSVVQPDMKPHAVILVVDKQVGNLPHSDPLLVKVRAAANVFKTRGFKVIPVISFMHLSSRENWEAVTKKVLLALELAGPAFPLSFDGSNNKALGDRQFEPEIQVIRVLQAAVQDAMTRLKLNTNEEAQEVEDVPAPAPTSTIMIAVSIFAVIVAAVLWFSCKKTTTPTTTQPSVPVQQQNQGNPLQPHEYPVRPRRNLSPQPVKADGFVVL